MGVHTKTSAADTARGERAVGRAGRLRLSPLGRRAALWIISAIGQGWLYPPIFHLVGESVFGPSLTVTAFITATVQLLAGLGLLASFDQGERLLERGGGEG